MKKKKKIKKIEYPDNEIYIGEVDSEGVPHGNGKYIFSNGDELIGESWHGYQPEKCTWKFSDGSQFVGEYFSQENKGLGKFTYPNGATYEGEIGTNLKREGEGKLRLKDGTIMEGTYQSGTLTGHGIVKFMNGDHYSGQVSEGKIQGEGRKYYSSGDYYQGGFMNNQHHGQGLYRTTKGYA